MITVSLFGVDVTSTLEGGPGLPVDSTTNVANLKMLLFLHDAIATQEEVAGLHIYMDGRKVRVMMIFHFLGLGVLFE